MKELLFMVGMSFAAIFSAPAYADGFASDDATVISVKPKYKIRYEVEDVQVCEEVSVPVYGEYIDVPSDGEVAGGALIGGAIGNQFGNGDGKTAMTVLGAIIGANKASKPKIRTGVTDYIYETQCHYEQQSTPVKVKVGYFVTYEQNGYYHEGFMKTRPVIGSTINVQN